MKGRLLGLLFPLIVLVALLVAALLVLVPGFSGSGAIVTPAEAVGLLGLIVLAAGLAALAWWRERRQRERELRALAHKARAYGSGGQVGYESVGSDYLERRQLKRGAAG